MTFGGIDQTEKGLDCLGLGFGLSHYWNKYLEINPGILAFLEQFIVFEDSVLWSDHNKNIPWCPLNVQIVPFTLMYTPFCVPYHDLCTIPLCNFEDKRLDEHSIQEPIQCYTIGSFLFTQRQCVNAHSTNCDLETATTHARDVLLNSGLERKTYPLTFDCGASQCLTAIKSDFL
jgi:hypothetical protein